MNNTFNNNIPKRNNLRNLYKCFNQIVITAQLFGLLPIDGLRQNKAKKIAFKWCSFNAIYCHLVIITTFIIVVMSLYDLITDSPSLHKITTATFYVNSLLISIIFLQVARKWRKIMLLWEISDGTLCYYNSNTDLTGKTNTIMFVILLNACVEHVLSNINKYIYVKARNETDIERKFFLIDYCFIFDYVPYSRVVAIFLKALSVINTFGWNFMDVFIMQISVCLSERFRQLNNKIRIACYSQEKSLNTWRCIRNDYNILCRLCEKIDSYISGIILMSFGNNIFFILVQLYKSLRKRETAIERFYFLFSFALLLFRTLAVCLFAARINDEGLKSLDYVPVLRTDIYSTEIERLVDQIRLEQVALTGKGLFKITRGIVFSIAGTVVTYELFLFQFNVNSNYL